MDSNSNINSLCGNLLTGYYGFHLPLQGEVMDRLSTQVVVKKIYAGASLAIINRADAKDLLQQAKERASRAGTAAEKAVAYQDVFVRFNNLFLAEQILANYNFNNGD